MESTTTIYRDRAPDERGTTIVEFALTLAVVAFIIGSGLEALRLVYTSMMCEYAVAATLRNGVTIGNGTSQARGAALEQRVISSAHSYGIEIPPDPAGSPNNPFVTVCALGTNHGVCLPGDLDEAGEDSELVEIRIDLPVPVAFSALTYILRLSAFARNEPFQTE